MKARAVPTRSAGDGGHGAQERAFAHPTSIRAAYYSRSFSRKRAVQAETARAGHEQQQCATKQGEIFQKIIVLSH
jgi:hypothetical protein